MTVKQITDVIEAFAPLSLQEKWDNCGLCVGSPEQEVRGVMIGLDPTPELFREALCHDADMVITHHPLIFSPLRRIDTSDPTGLALTLAVKNSMAVYATHTPSDKVLAGVSGAMARKLNLDGVEVLSQEEAGIGLGAVGNLAKPISSREAVELVKKTFGLSTVRCSRLLDTPISRIAMCGGSGSSLISDAKASGAQLYLCGDISYHHFFTSGDFMVMDVGHFESEVEIVNILYSLLRKNFPNFAIHLTDNLYSTNPIQYL